MSRADGCYCAVAINCIKSRSDDLCGARAAMRTTESIVDGERRSLPTALKGSVREGTARVAETAVAHAHCAAARFFFLLLGTRPTRPG